MEMIINERTLSCCGQPVANGKCSCRNEAKPQPLGLPVYNFGNEVPDEQHVANSNPISNGGGLPQTDWDAIFNEDAGQTRPVVKPITRPPVKNPQPVKSAGIPVQPWTF